MRAPMYEGMKFKPYQFEEFPMMVYHRTPTGGNAHLTVESKEALEALRGEYFFDHEMKKPVPQPQAAMPAVSPKASSQAVPAPAKASPAAPATPAAATPAA